MGPAGAIERQAPPCRLKGGPGKPAVRRDGRVFLRGQRFPERPTVGCQIRREPVEGFPAASISCHREALHDTAAGSTCHPDSRARRTA